MKLAIQEHLLPGGSVLERLEVAAELGIAGVEFNADMDDARIMEVGTALVQTGLQAAALNAGGTHLLHPDFDTRDAAIARIRQSMADILDLGGEGVIFASHRADTPRLPDLRPFKHPLEMEADFLATQLRATLADLAYAMGASLYLAPLNRYETHLLHRVEQALTILKKNDDHLHLKIAANTFHLAQEEADLHATLRQHAGRFGVVQLADHHNGLPGTGFIDFAAVIDALKAGEYQGWLIISGRAASRDGIAAAVTNITGLL